MDTGLIIHTILGLLLLLVPAGALYMLERQMLPKFAVAVGRMVVQLLVLCLMVWALIRIDGPWLLIVWLVAMAVYAGWIVQRRCKTWHCRYRSVDSGSGIACSCLRSPLVRASDGAADGTYNGDDHPRTEHLCYCPENRRTAV